MHSPQSPDVVATGVPQNPLERRTDKCAADPSLECADEPDTFRRFITTTRGPRELVILSLLISFSFGSIIGVAPGLATDRFARFNHGYTGPDCVAAVADELSRPPECDAGAEDAQNYAALFGGASSAVTVLANPLVGAFSDRRGRRGIFLAALTVGLLSPVVLVFLLAVPSADPLWYYAASFAYSCMPFQSVLLASLADATPPRWRTATFGLSMAAVFLGFSLAPCVLLVTTHFRASLISLGFYILSFLFTIFAVPETLPEAVAEVARESAKSSAASRPGGCRGIISFILRPLSDCSILIRTPILRFLSAINFFSSATLMANQTFSLYYIKEYIAFTDKDISVLFALTGIFSIIVQGGVLPPLANALGSRNVLLIAFISGCAQNIIYAGAKTKGLWFDAAVLSSLHSMAFSAISSLISNNVSDAEQGQVQGALSSLVSLAGMLGPVAFRMVPGPPGSMFLLGAKFLAVAAGLSFMMPESRRGMGAGEEYTEVKNSEEEEETSDDSLASPNGVV